MRNLSFVFYILALIYTSPLMAGWKDSLFQRVDCHALDKDSLVPLKKKAEILGFIMDGNTSIELKDLKFKHLTQLGLFRNEYSKLMAIRHKLRPEKPQDGNVETQEVVAQLGQFFNEEGFLDPRRVCACVLAEAGKADDLAIKYVTGPVNRLFAVCIQKTFVPTMFNDPSLVDTYE